MSKCYSDSMAPDRRNGRRTARARKPEEVERPIGITVISILGFLFALSMIISGIVLIMFAEFGSLVLRAMVGRSVVEMIFSAVVAVAGAVFIVLGILMAIVSYALWNMKRWGWIIGVALLIIDVILDIGSLVVNPVISTIRLLISGVVLYYLWANRELFK